MIKDEQTIDAAAGRKAEGLYPLLAQLVKESSTGLDYLFIVHYASHIYSQARGLQRKTPPALGTLQAP